MAYNEKVAARIRKKLSDHSTEEKEMMGGIAFMVKGKMCVGVIKDDMIARIDPALYESALEMNGCRPMDFTGRPLKGWVYIDETGMKSQKDFDYWVGLALEFNSKAKASKKKTVKRSK